MWEDWNEAQREALRELKAAVWDEGYLAGHVDTIRDDRTPNPYRKETQ